jgi:hypothetical protein
MANVVLVSVNNASRMLPVLVVNNRMSLLKMELVIKLVNVVVCVDECLLIFLLLLGACCTASKGCRHVSSSGECEGLLIL